MGKYSRCIIWNKGKIELFAKAGLKFNIPKIRNMASGLITSWQIEGENWKQ